MSWLSSTIKSFTGQKASDKASDDAAGKSLEQFKISKETLDPFINFGKTQGLTGLENLMSGKTDLFSLPGVMKSFNSGADALQRKLSAQGMNLSGNSLLDLADYTGGFSRNLYNDEFNRLFGIAGLGQSSAAALSGASIQTGNTLANTYMNKGNQAVAGQGNFMQLGSSLAETFFG